MPFAAAALERLVKRLGVEKVVTSAFGLREGVLLEALAPRVRGADPMLAGAEAMARRAGAEIAYGRSLETWVAPLAPLFETTLGASHDPKLVLAACRLADIGGALHPDHRAELAAQQVLFAQFAGLGHADRVFLSRVIYHRYAGRSEDPNAERYDALLPPEAREAALRLGLTLRLAGSISSRSARLLGESRIGLNEGRVKLTFTSRGADLATDVVEKRLAQLADAVDRATPLEAN